MRYRSRENGLMLLDAMVGMTIVGMLLGVLAVAMSQQRQSAAFLSTQRRLDRLAEGVLTDLQQGVTPVVPAWDTETQPTYAVNNLSDTQGPREGWIWVEVAVGYEKFDAFVIGALPEQFQAQIGGTP